MDRKLFIGGSDIAAVMGMSRWKTPLKLWAEKTGIVEPDDLSDIEAVQLGTELEDFVARKFQKKMDLKVRRPPVTHYIDRQFPWMACQVDRLIVNEKDYHGVDGLLEVKTCSMWKMKEWDGEGIPHEYILQVLWQLMITKRDVGWIACLIGGQKFVYKKILADNEMEEKMRSAAINFWEMIQQNTPPVASGYDNELLVSIYPKASEELQEADETVNEAVAHLQEVKGHITTLEAEKEDIEAGLKQIIAESAGIKTSKYIVTWRPQIRTSLDTEKIKEDGIYEKYSKKKVIKVLGVKLNKEK